MNVLASTLALGATMLATRATQGVPLLTRLVVVIVLGIAGGVAGRWVGEELFLPWADEGRGPDPQLRR